MAKRGPKPKTALTDRPRPSAPGDDDGRWCVPDHLEGDDEAVKAWAHVVGLLAAAGNLDRTDPVMVEAYAINVSMLRAARHAVVTDGPTVMNGGGGISANPACAVVNSATMRIKAIVNDLGLCPSTSKYAAAPAPHGDQSAGGKWDGMLGVVGG